MQIVKDKILVLRTRKPDKYRIIPRSKVLNEFAPGAYEVAVYWGLDEARVLRNLGVRNVPSPITRRYGWPGVFKPFDHQRETAAFLTLNQKAFCFNEPGTGKTSAALWAADYLMNIGKVRRCLIICPLSIMKSAWLRDIMQTTLHRTAAIAYHANAERRKEIVQNDYEFVIVNYDALQIIASTVVKDGRFDLVICDEANAVKNTQTRRWKALKQILNHDTYLWMMTGTPAPQSPLDAYGLAKLVNPTAVPNYITAWKDMVMNKVSMFKWVPKPRAAETVHRVLQPAIRFTKAECLDLPPVMTETREVPLTAQQEKYYKLLKEQLVIQAAGETVSVINAASAVNKLLQISAGATYTDDGEVIVFDCSHRLNVLREVLEETNRKIIVFAHFRHSIETIMEFLAKEKIEAEQIHGDVSVHRRTEIFKTFQSEDTLKVLVIQPQAAAHGVTLTAADTVVFWSPVMSVENYIQCIARADRIGQNSTSVTVVHLQGSDIERRMYRVLEQRLTDHNAIIDLYKEELTSNEKPSKIKLQPAGESNV